jgi:hypothetical protein
MNTCLSVVYLKLSKIDSRLIRLALITLALVSSGGLIEALPIAGDVGI